MSAQKFCDFLRRKQYVGKRQRNVKIYQSIYTTQKMCYTVLNKKATSVRDEKFYEGNVYEKDSSGTSFQSLS